MSNYKSPRKLAAEKAGFPHWANLDSTRQRALARGVDFYFIGKPAQCGHVVPRSISAKTSCCIACAGWDLKHLTPPNVRQLSFDFAEVRA